MDTATAPYGAAAANYVVDGLPLPHRGVQVYDGDFPVTVKFPGKTGGVFPFQYKFAPLPELDDFSILYVD